MEVRLTRDNHLNLMCFDGQYGSTFTVKSWKNST